MRDQRIYSWVLMSLFSIFKRKKRQQAELHTHFDETMTKLREEFRQNNFLGKAAEAKHKALEAVKAKDFDAAWRFFHEQKQHFIQHAARFNFSETQTLALDASVSEHLANILRLEGKHDDALVHIIYWVACTDMTTRRQDQKLPAYFNREKYNGADIAELHRFVSETRSNPELRNIQLKVQEWRSRA